MDQLLAQLQDLVVRLTQLADVMWPLAHPKAVVVALINGSAGLLETGWNGFILSTTDSASGFVTTKEFISNSTIHRYEPSVQLVCDAALVLVAIWASFRIMWGHGLRSQYTARILLPRLMMGALLVNFALPLFQMVVSVSNSLCVAAQAFVTLDNPKTWLANMANDPSAGVWEVLTTAILIVGYDVLAITYLVRFALLIVLAITAPIAGLLFTLPETHHLSKLWASQFTTNLFMQPAQLFVLSIGFTLEKEGNTPFHHLFALASLLIVLKVPGAFGGSEKMAHKLQSTVHEAFTHIEHALVKA
jgi:hypothetical protein